MVSKAKVQGESTRRARIAVLGATTARCERCLADCAATLGEWAIDGMCPEHRATKAAQQKVAGH